MKTLVIKGSAREQTGKKTSKSLRKQGFVLCVMYGGKDTIHFYAQEKNFRNLVYSPNVYLIKIELGDEQYETVLQDIQFHPVTDRIIHADFIQVFKDKKVTVKLPIKLTGSSIGLKNGGKLRQRRRSLKVRGLVDHLPDFVEVDMTDVDIGDFIKINDLSYNYLEILDPQRAMVAGVVSSRLVAKGMKEAVVEEVAEEEAVEEEVPPEEVEETPGTEEAPSAEPEK